MGKAGSKKSAFMGDDNFTAGCPFLPAMIYKVVCPGVYSATGHTTGLNLPQCGEGLFGFKMAGFSAPKLAIPLKLLAVIITSYPVVLGLLFRIPA